MNYPRDQITGVILAGGRARRMGGEDKGLISLHGQAMISYAVAMLVPQVGRLLINANRNQERYAHTTGHEVIADAVGGYAGPLAGMVSAMRVCDTEFLLCVPCDCPLLPANLGGRLFTALVQEDAEISVAHDGNRLQPVFVLMNTGLEASMTAYLQSGQSKIDRWYRQHRLVHADFTDASQLFQNINTTQECQAMEAILAATV